MEQNARNRGNLKTVSAMNVVSIKTHFSVCYDQAFDIVFVIDGSVRTGAGNYRTLLEWIAKLSGSFNLRCLSYVILMKLTFYQIHAHWTGSVRI